MEVKRWITHCDTIGDVFKNPAVLEFITAWHHEETGKKLSFKLNWKGEPIFTPEFYEFIRKTFSNRDTTETFYRFIRETLLENETLHTAILEKYSHSSITRALLCFEALANQISRVEGLTISGIFKTRVADIIMESQSEPAHNEDDEMFGNVVVFDSIKAIMEHGMIPINPDGEILCHMQKGDRGHVVNILWDDRVHEVDTFWNSLENEVITEVDDEKPMTRREIILSIEILERILTHYNDQTWKSELSEADEQVYIKYTEEFDGQPENEKLADNMRDIHLWYYLVKKRKELEAMLKDTKASDHTQIADWELQWLEAGTSQELPEEWEPQAKPDIPEGEQVLKIVSSQ